MRMRFDLVITAAVVCAGTMSAQKPGTFGIGVTMGATSFSPNSENMSQAPSLTVPMTFGSFRLEPEFAYAGGSFEVTDPFFGDVNVSGHSFTIGTGAYFVTSPSSGFLLYMGPRLGIQRSSTTDESTSPEVTTTTTDTFFGVALGGEHFFSSHLSLGGEGRITHYVGGEPKIDGQSAGPDSKSSTTATAGVVVVRFYF